MLKSILHAAFRNIVRHKAFSAINLAGLSISMSLCLLIILIVREQFTFDNFHKDGDRIYQINARVLFKEGGGYDFASVPMPVGAALKEEYAFAEEVVGMNRFVIENAAAGRVTVPLTGLFADPSFLKVFNFPLESGSASTSLSGSKNIVLTHEAAAKLFGAEDPFGKTVSMGTYGDFTVGGVFQPIPGKTHLAFEALLPTAALSALERTHVISPVSNNWNEFYSSYIYVKVKNGADDQAGLALAAISQKYGKNLTLDGGYTGYQFFLHPLNKITPGPSVANQMGPGMPLSLLIFLGALAAVVLIMSVFNFTNLTIAKSLTRAREIGVRKIVGAKRRQLFAQFVGESVIFALLALVLSYLILQFLKTGISALSLSRNFALGLGEDMTIGILFGAFGILVGVIAGVLPATYLSALRPLKVMKDSGNIRVHSKLTFRKVLVATQFTFSLIFVITVLIIYKQIDFMVNADYGFNKDNVININLQDASLEKLSTGAASLGGVRSVGGISHVPGTWNNQSGSYKKEKSDEPVQMSQLIVDEHYLDNLGLSFLAGKNFTNSSEGSRERHVVLNEQALKRFNFKTPESAIGETVLLNDTLVLEVTGVVKDFHYRPLSDRIGPLAMRCRTAEVKIMSVWIEPSRKAEVLASLSGIWKKTGSKHPMSYAVMSDEMEDAYRQSGMVDFLIVAGYITMLAVSLACLGMLGMALYAVQTRVKEVGIRKVIGASAFDIVFLLSKAFMKLILIAVVIGVPASWIIGDQLLSQFAFRIEVSAGLILLGVGLIVLSGWLMVGSQALTAALADPVESIRYE